MEVMSVTAPNGVTAGESFLMVTPTGATMSVVVPDGIKSGDTFTVAVPTGGAAADKDAVG